MHQLVTLLRSHNTRNRAQDDRIEDPVVARHEIAYVGTNPLVHQGLL